MAQEHPITARAGDLVDARGLPGQPTRTGEIIDVLGEGPHTRWLVRWDDRHESILYPADGVVVHRPQHRAVA